MGHAERPAAEVGDLHGGAGLDAVEICNVAGKDPGMAGGDPIGRLPVHSDGVHLMACRRAMRSSVDGCVEKSRMNQAPVCGCMINRCAVEGVASMGMRF